MSSQGFQPPQSNYPPPSSGNPQQPNNNNQQPMPPPPPQNTLFFSRKVGRVPLWVLVLILFLALVLYHAVASAGGSTQQASSTPTQAPTQVPTQPTATPNTAKVAPQVTEYPTDTPQPTPTATATSAVTPTTGATNVTITHGMPHLGGPISDFYGKYGRQIAGVGVQSGSAPNGSPEGSVAWVTDSNNAYLLSVHYYTPSTIVDYIDYVGPSDWSKAQYRDYLISNFAPPGTAEDTQANQDWASQGGDTFNPIAYTSDIGKFFLHISDGDGNMNTV